MIIQLYTSLSTPENTGKKIGLFRIITSIFGGLLVSYLGMTLLAFLLPGTVHETAVVSIMFNTLAWAGVTTYIALAHTKLSALLRIFTPTLLFTISIYFFY